MGNKNDKDVQPKKPVIKVTQRDLGDIVYDPKTLLKVFEMFPKVKAELESKIEEWEIIPTSGINDEVVGIYSSEFHEEVHRQGKLGFCWAHACADLILVALSRKPELSGRILPSHGEMTGCLIVIRLKLYFFLQRDNHQLKPEIIKSGSPAGRHGDSIVKVMKEVNSLFDIYTNRIKPCLALRGWWNVLDLLIYNLDNQRSPIVASFHLSAHLFRAYQESWNEFESNFTMDKLAKRAAQHIVKLKLGDDIKAHAILLVNHLPEEKMFRIKNSWGTVGGDKGFANMGYEFFEEEHHVEISYWNGGLFSGD